MSGSMEEHEAISEPTEEEIDEIIAESGGDPRQAIRNLLHDLTQMALDADACVSRGYVRGVVALRLLGRR